MRTAAARAQLLSLPGFILAFALACVCLPAAAQSGDDEDWSDDMSRALAVNEGELVFIAPPADRAPLHADTDLRLDANSSASGWVDMDNPMTNRKPLIVLVSQCFSGFVFIFEFRYTNGACSMTWSSLRSSRLPSDSAR